MKKRILSLLLMFILITTVSCSKDNKKNTRTLKSNTPTTESVNNSEVSEATNNPNTEGFEEGNLAPDFEVKLLSGETVKLSDFKGKPVLLNFWATWCGPCKFEMPDFQKLHEEYGENLIILSVNIGESENEVKKYIDENNFSFGIGLDEMGETGYPVMALPTTFLLDKDGRINFSAQGVPSEDVHGFYKEKIDSLLK
ncbi:TlpA family protein disulfide reductase [Miniphocaeibacter massiliensis]|uniref:TlpA family protein disulfide reductase n=1 Tax=Miniphocaeibacter massiliensis TaxID=2041841 RepID=UPI000C1BAFF8|nr:TlpA disulfide reductase family protein [Miniphocaeibacter massiliensis]